MIQQRECRVLCPPGRCFGLPHHFRAIFLPQRRVDTLGGEMADPLLRACLRGEAHGERWGEGDGGLAGWGAAAQVAQQQHGLRVPTETQKRCGVPPRQAGGCVVWVQMAVPATQPAPPGEAISARRRPGAQFCWDKLAGCHGISAIRSSRDRLAFCQSHAEGRSWLSPSKVRVLRVQPAELDAGTLLAAPASDNKE